MQSLVVNIVVIVIIFYYNHYFRMIFEEVKKGAFARLHLYLFGLLKSVPNQIRVVCVHVCK